MSRKALIALGVLGLVGAAGEASAQAVGTSTAPTVSIPAVGGSGVGIGNGVLTSTPAVTAGTTTLAPAAVGTPVTTSVGGVIVGPTAVGGTVMGSTAPIVLGAPAGSQVGPIHPYSYYVEFPNPARTYVPYASWDTFTYQGQAYGHAYDRWTWSAMSNASPGLGRYYQILH